jgi:hypothetical protein
MEIAKGREGVKKCGGGSEPKQPRRDTILPTIARELFRMMFCPFATYKQRQPLVAHMLGRVVSTTAVGVALFSLRFCLPAAVYSSSLFF